MSTVCQSALIEPTFNCLSEVGVDPPPLRVLHRGMPLLLTCMFTGENPEAALDCSSWMDARTLDITFGDTVEPLYNGHHWGMELWPL